MQTCSQTFVCLIVDQALLHSQYFYAPLLAKSEEGIMRLSSLVFSSTTIYLLTSQMTCCNRGIYLAYFLKKNK